MDELTPTPDVAAGELIYLSPDDLGDRVCCACDAVSVVIEELLEATETDFCDEHFMELVSEIVVSVMHAVGIVHHDLDAEFVAHVRNTLTKRLAELQAP